MRDKLAYMWVGNMIRCRLVLSPLAWKRADADFERILRQELEALGRGIREQREQLLHR